MSCEVLHAQKIWGCGEGMEMRLEEDRWMGGAVEAIGSEGGLPSRSDI